MELQWPLILFTTLISWSAGVFGTQALLAFRGQAKKSQFACWVVAAILLVAGVIAVFFHLHHWERIFNGFGNPTSGITQELVMIVVAVVVAIVYLIFMRRAEDGASVPKWLSVVSVVVAVVLVVVMANSYLVASRPAWDSFLWILCMFGGACAIGPLTVAAVMAIRGDDMKPIALPSIIGTIVGLVTYVAYAIWMQVSSSALSTVGFYSNPTDPTAPIVQPSSVVTAFTGTQGVLVILGALVVGALIPVVLSFIGKYVKGGTDHTVWMVCSIIGVVCCVVGFICFRVAFYNAGLSVFMFY
ncbi:MAG: hypothetical protein LUD72_03795 [Bacteroidales bacterium]|nr:hypothetical protein [Bacteroidales bacterium]